MSILDGELAEIIGDALLDADIPLDIVVTRSTLGGGTPWNPEAPTLTDHACKGFADAYSEDLRAGSLIHAGDAKITIVATTLDIEPTPGDTVTIGGVSYTAISVATDPARALWEVQGRRA